MNKVLFQMNVKGKHIAITLMVLIFVFVTTYTITYEAGYKKGMLTKQQEAVEYMKKVVKTISDNYVKIDDFDNESNDIDTDDPDDAANDIIRELIE